MDTTLQDHGPSAAPLARPGLLVLWSTNTPLCTPHDLTAAGLTIGRDPSNDLSFAEDAYLSRNHGTIAYLAGGWIVEAHKTAFLDGVPFEGRRSLDDPAVVRFGRTIFLLTRDLSRFDPPTAIADGYVQSAALREAFTDAARAAADGRTLLILAPTGAGKDAVARAFHHRGPRAKGPFVVVDSPSVRGDTAVSRLFGARRGAYTGAVESEGLIATAEGGTLFVDELGDMSLEVQASVLRAFQERTIVPVGGTTARKVDFTLVAATHVDLERAAEEGRFRSDLLGRLEQRVVVLGSLEERRDEIPFLVALFASRAKSPVAVDAGFVEACLLRAWPRNVRQLESVVDRAADRASQTGRPLVADDAPPVGQRPSVPPPAPESPDDEARREFMAAYREANGDADLVKQKLGIQRATFYARKKKYGIR